MSSADAATDARKRMDENDALMNDSGKPYDGTATDRNLLLGDLHRRSVYAVASLSTTCGRSLRGSTSMVRGVNQDSGGTKFEQAKGGLRAAQ